MDEGFQSDEISSISIKSDKKEMEFECDPKKKRCVRKLKED
jgi:hypothetical protein